MRPIRCSGDRRLFLERAFRVSILYEENLFRRDLNVSRALMVVPKVGRRMT